MNTITQEAQQWLARHLHADFQVEKHAYSNQDDVYVVRTSGRVYYLKIAPALAAEYQNMQRIRPYLLVPDVVGFGRIGDKEYLLLGEVPGKNLAELVSEWTPINLVKEFARAARAFHALDAGKLFPKDVQPGMVVLHGDLSMPNILCTKPGAVGYIDLAQIKIGPVDEDLADAIWSLQRNLGPGYGERFLREYGDVVMTERLRKALEFEYQP